MLVDGILNPRVEDMFHLLCLLYLLGKFSGYFVGGGLGTGFLPSLTHFACIYHEWDPKTLDLKKIRNRGIQWYWTRCTSYSGFYENPNQSLFSLLPVRKLVVYRQL